MLRDRINMRELYRRLGFKGGKIPYDVSLQSRVQVPFAPMSWEAGIECMMEVLINPGEAPKPGVKSSAHRVFVKCPTCGYLVPAGRLHMHEGTKRCRKLRDEAHRMVHPNGILNPNDQYRPEIPEGDIDHDDEDRRAYREELSQGRAP